MAKELNQRVIAERSAWIQDMLSRLRQLTAESHESFGSDPYRAAAAESFLRRALEALLDLGRHVLAKGFGSPVSEYKDVARSLVRVGVLTQEQGQILIQLAGYRNRLVHFYGEVSEEELHHICAERLGDVEVILAAILRWVAENPGFVARAE